MNGASDKRPLAILLMGPTASGKTDLAMALRERLGAELISVDSAKTAAGSPESTESELPAVMAEASNSRRVRCCSAIARIPLRGNAVGAGADRSGVGSSPSARPNDSRSTRQSILRDG